MAAPSALTAQDSATQPDSLAVLAVAHGIIEADNARDLTRVLTYYSDSAMLLPPDASPIIGRTAIIPRYRDLFATYTPEIKGEVQEMVVSGSLAYVRGQNRGVLRSRRGGEERALNDVFLMLLARETDGVWRIVRLMWHSAGPADPRGAGSAALRFR